MKNFSINNDITLAETLPSSFYRSGEVFDRLKEAVFTTTWQLLQHQDVVKLAETVYPINLLEGFLNEPLLVIKDSKEEISCLTNVCTHRGALLVSSPNKMKKIICPYHGRKFGLDGTFESMPEFSQTKNFPRDCDNLHKLPLKKWFGFLFTSINPSFDFSEVIDNLNERLYFLPSAEYVFAPEFSKDYIVNAHWSLYCDNFLEGFHIPFVHKDLNNVLDYGSYKSIIYNYCNLQIGYGKTHANCFHLPQGHPDYGKNVSAWYYWIFPNLMLNFYTWGLSINIVKPLSPHKTKVAFLTYILDKNLYEEGQELMIDKVEREDEFVVESVQKGINSRFYPSGRFSPTRETGVHQFHSLLAKYLAKNS